MGKLVQEEKRRDLREMLSLKGRKEQKKVDPAAGEERTKVLGREADGKN